MLPRRPWRLVYGTCHQVAPQEAEVAVHAAVAGCVWSAGEQKRTCEWSAVHCINVQKWLARVQLGGGECVDGVERVARM
jgi:hypothetical protein